VGKTSGVYGVRDSDAYFVEADLLRSVLDLLLSSECHSLPAIAIRVDGAHSALRRLCLLTLDIGALLQEFPRVLSRVVAFLSSALPYAFEPQPGHTVAKKCDEELWTLLHVMMTSDCCNFLEDVLNACGASRMHDATDLRAVRTAMFGSSVSKDAKKDLRAALCDMRLVLCHTLLLLFHLISLFRLTEGLPSRFVTHVVSLYKVRLAPPLQKALVGPLSGCWPEIREALGALAMALEKAPLSATDSQWFTGAREAFRVFAVRRFLVAEGSLSDEAAEEQLDTFRFGAKKVDMQPWSTSSETGPLQWATYATEHPTTDEKIRAKEQQTLRRPSSGKATVGDAIDDGKVGPPPMGAQPPRFEKTYVNMKLKEDLSSNRAALGIREAEPPIANLASLPQPLPLGSGALRSTARSLLARSSKIPLAATGSTPRGCFYNTASMEYVS
jgi:hypothetical protein